MSFSRTDPSTSEAVRPRGASPTSRTPSIFSVEMNQLSPNHFGAHLFAGPSPYPSPRFRGGRGPDRIRSPTRISRQAVARAHLINDSARSTLRWGREGRGAGRRVVLREQAWNPFGRKRSKRPPTLRPTDRPAPRPSRSSQSGASLRSQARRSRIANRSRAGYGSPSVRITGRFVAEPRRNAGAAGDGELPVPGRPQSGAEARDSPAPGAMRRDRGCSGLEVDEEVPERRHATGADRADAEVRAALEVARRPHTAVPIGRDEERPVRVVGDRGA
jgi:hypothetical protein